MQATMSALALQNQETVGVERLLWFVAHRFGLLATRGSNVIAILLGKLLYGRLPDCKNSCV